MPPKTLYAIDQFVMRGGRVLLLVDPNSGADTSGQDPSNPLAAAMANHSSNLAPLLAAWGVDYDPTKVIGDLQRGLEVRTNMQSPPPIPPSLFAFRLRVSVTPCLLSFFFFLFFRYLASCLSSGNRITSRIVWLLVSNMTSRSMPTSPPPAV